MSLRNAVSSLPARTAGVLLALGAAAPAFAATFPFGLSTEVTPRDWLLVGSLVLLAVALALRLMQRGRAPDAGPEAPDLRWWINP